MQDRMRSFAASAAAESFDHAKATYVRHAWKLCRVKKVSSRDGKGRAKGENDASDWGEAARTRWGRGDVLVKKTGQVETGSDDGSDPARKRVT
jgi:hypothetical protein